MKKIIKKYYGLVFFLSSVAIMSCLIGARFNNLEQQKSDDSHIIYQTESSQNTFVK